MHNSLEVKEDLVKAKHEHTRLTDLGHENVGACDGCSVGYEHV